MLTIEFTRLEDGKIRAVVFGPGLFRSSFGLEQDTLNIFETDNRERLMDQLGYAMIERMEEVWPIGGAK